MLVTPTFLVLPVLAAILATASGFAPAEADTPLLAVYTPEDASHAESLAAREICRYVYVRTGRLPRIETFGEVLPAGGYGDGTVAGDGIITGRKDRPALAALAANGVGTAIASLGEEQFLLETVEQGGRRLLLVAGGGDAGVLYGAYRLAERLGVRFFLHGDAIPDEPIPHAVPDLHERGAPLFALRGIQPFHDFPEGPDWWNLDDYKAVISQLPKLGMNFFGLHTYPEGHPNAEPTVWIGLPGDVAGDGSVSFAYPSSYQNTLRGNWGYAARKTSDFVFGAAQLFDRDAYSCDAMDGACPSPETPGDCIAVFERTAAMLRAAFRHSRRLGVKTCVGTETPLVVPALVKQRLEEQGKDPADPAVIRELYEGIFQRAARAYAPDYYWFWTPEGWTWQGATEEQVDATIGDLAAAAEAAKKIGPPFRLATCGWVLGPQNDRSLFDRELPAGMALSCINRQVGMEAVDKGFAGVKRPGKWAIPWLEDDPALTSPQLWVGRMREDAADALRYGCSGLMGIHWRTRVLGPNVLALAQAAWDQSGWDEAPSEQAAALSAGPEGGTFAAFPDNPMEGTEDDALYRTVRYDVDAYRFPVPDGAYDVTLRFCEPHYGEAGKRVFGVKLQGDVVIERLDVFEEVGRNRALDFTFEGINVTGGRLDVDFVRIVEFPCIAAIAVTGKERTWKVNCGGPAHDDYRADWPASRAEPRGLPSGDFYRDWAKQMFGADAAEPIARIFEANDCRLPRPSDWINGPGGIRPDGRPWEQVRDEYAYVDELAAQRGLVTGAGSRERFDYWLETFRLMRAMARVNCTWARFNAAMEMVKAEEDAAAKKELARSRALPLRRELVGCVGVVYDHLLATTTNPGELGTIANWEQHILPGLLEAPGKELAEILGEPLPGDAMPSRSYRGPLRVIVPTVRTSLDAGEKLKLDVIILSETPPAEAAVYWRGLDAEAGGVEGADAAGEPPFARIPLEHVNRGVYRAKLPPASNGWDLVEYRVTVRAEDGETVFFPATAPGLSQTLVVVP